MMIRLPKRLKARVLLSCQHRNLSTEFEDFSDNSINEVNASSTLVPVVGQISTNSTNTFRAAGPSNTVVSPTFEKSSYVDTSQYPDDPNMPELEDITYFDDEEDVGAVADFNNLETNITASPIPTTRVHKDHPKVWVLVDLPNGKRAIGFEEPDYPDKVYKVVKEIYRLHQAPRSWDSDGEDVDVHIYRSMIGSLMYLTSLRPGIMFAVAKSGMKSLKKNLHVTNILSAGYLTTPQMVLNSPCLTHIKNWLVQIKRCLSWLVQKQKALGKDKSNLFIVDSLLKTIWLIVTVVSSKFLLQRVKKLERKNKLKVSGFRRLKKVGTAQRVESSGDTIIDDVSKQGEIIANMDADEDVTLKDVAVIAKEVEDDELKPVELKEVVEVVTAAKLMIEVVTAATATITAATTPIIAAPIVTRRRKGVVIRDPEETTTLSIIIHTEPKSKDKGKGIITEAQARKNMMIYLRNMAGFKMDYFKGMSYDDIHPIFEKYFNSNMAFLEKTKEQMEEEDNRALKRTSKSLKEKAAKKQKLDEEAKELKKHLQIVPNNDDDVYTEATPLALKVPIVDYAIHTKNNKPYFKIIRADGTHHLFLSFLSLLRNFYREDLEVLWQIVKERFASLKPKNFSDDFLLTTLTCMFEKPNVEAQF
nr:hypothetical protein [Tanacetum cinerariifolium]